ncbi:hypothetical protein ACIRS3_35580 [Streptomyces virginiae]
MATWSEHSKIGHHYEDLLADCSVSSRALKCRPSGSSEQCQS